MDVKVVKYGYLVLALFPLCPLLGPCLTPCCKNVHKRVMAFTFYRYLYMQTKDWN